MLEVGKRFISCSAAGQNVRIARNPTLGLGAAMDLKKCPACKNMVAAESIMCPICGCEKDRRWARWLIAAIVILPSGAWLTLHFLRR
jgi:RNA polymerase subunit RPABC4/transcription elongation factor Spt4